MTRFVLDAPVAIALVDRGPVVAPEHALLAPTLLRSDVLALLYAGVRRGERTDREARAVLDGIRGLRLRLLGDRVLQAHARRIARALDRPDTYRAEYLALTELQADAFVTLDPDLASAAHTIVKVAGIDAVTSVDEVSGEPTA